MGTSLLGLVPVWDQLVDEVLSFVHFFGGESEQVWEGLAVWQSGFLVSKFVEVWILEGFHWCWSLFGVVDQEFGHEVDGFSWGSASEHFFPRQGSDLWESIFFVVWVHGKDVLSWRSSQNFDDFNQLVDSRVTRENRLSKHEFSNNTSNRPHINVSRVVRVTKNKLRSSVISRANIRHIWFSFN